MKQVAWYASWTVRYIGMWCVMLRLADYQLMYRMVFPVAVPYAVLGLSIAWLAVGLGEFDQHVRRNSA